LTSGILSFLFRLSWVSDLDSTSHDTERVWVGDMIEKLRIELGTYPTPDIEFQIFLAK
jgi:hypothetical protein